jgi:chromate transporter
MVTKILPGEGTASPSFSEALRFWFRLGLISFGGTAAHLGIMHDGLVERRKWIENEDFLHGLGHCLILPGPEAQQLAIYLGWKLHGIKGGIVAGTLFVLPSMILLLVLSIVYVEFGNVSWIAAVVSVLRPVALALVVYALTRLAKRSLTEPVQWAVAFLAMAAMIWLHVSVPLVMGGAILVGLGLAKWRRFSKSQTISASEPAIPPEEQASQQQAIRSLPKIFAGGMGLWLAPLAALYAAGRDYSFWSQLILFFTRTAFVTMGGSYTVIPYVAHVAVYRFHWLSPAQMLDGFALAETTPGPLIIVVAFVGFMAGFHHFDGSLLMGTLSLLLTTFYTFLPCFVFVFAGIPWMQSTRNNQSMKAVLSLIVAVVFAAMADLALFLVDGVLFHSSTHSFVNLNWIAVGLIGMSLLLLGPLKKGVGWVIGSALGFGILRALLRF